ncbi:helix-turn-helix transcriptional regulator [Mesorhizobium sp. CAU 1741]|uniref:helix-turn-helix transcriptional regulator n=1 Tax=Mesorhizobium sp. CAU 1741 TaxID=3140366 RepID=UPI00325BBA44
MLLQSGQADRADLFDDPDLAVWPVKDEWPNQSATTTSEAVRLMRKLAERINASGFSLFFCGAQGEARRLAPVLDDNFPGISLLSKALSHRGVESFARLAAESSVPLWWQRCDSRPFLSEAAACWAHEVESPARETLGIAFPVAQERGRHGLIVFSGEDMMLDENLLCDVHARCFSLFEDVSRQRVADCAKSPVVSRRELECLRLTADGLTSDDIAASLGLSVHTANQYLTNSTHKLNAVNRIHAVAKALRCGLID